MNRVHRSKDVARSLHTSASRHEAATAHASSSATPLLFANLLPPHPNARPRQSKPRRSQTLSKAESAQFVELIRQIPTSKLASIESEEIQRLRREQERAKKRQKTAGMIGGGGFRALTEAEEKELDRLTLKMVELGTEWDLMSWAKIQVVDNKEMIRSPLYPHVLLALFKTLRDTHNSPEAAFEIFHLVARDAESFVRGCSTKLYAQYLQTKWERFADVEGVAEGVDDMVMNGVQLDNRICGLVSDIGEAMKRDMDGEEYWQVALSTSSSTVADSPFTPFASTSTSSLPSRRYFNPSQVEAWVRLEQRVEEHVQIQDAAALANMDRQHKDSEETYRRRMAAEAAAAELARPNIFLGRRSFSTSTSSRPPHNLGGSIRNFSSVSRVWEEEKQRVAIGKIDRRLQITFTCEALIPPPDSSPDSSTSSSSDDNETLVKCKHRSTHEFSKVSYEKGIVLVECPSCKNRHLIADNLGWFSQTPSPAHPEGLPGFDNKKRRTVEDLMKEKGEEVKVTGLGSLEGGTWEIEG